MTYPYYPSVKREPFLLGEENRAVLLVLLWCLEDCLVYVRVELLALDTRIKPLQTVLLQSIHQYSLRHLEPAVKIGELFVCFGIDLVGWYGGEGSIKIIDGFYEVAGEALDGEILC